jgi:hypothetical protein
MLAVSVIFRVALDKLGRGLPYLSTEHEECHGELYLPRSQLRQIIMTGKENTVNAVSNVEPKG